MTNACLVTEKPADLMTNNGIGVSRETSYEIKRIDNDYFSEA